MISRHSSHVVLYYPEWVETVLLIVCDCYKEKCQKPTKDSTLDILYRLNETGQSHKLYAIGW